MVRCVQCISTNLPPQIEKAVPAQPSIQSCLLSMAFSLPHSFRGPITICTGDDRIAFSPAFAERVTLLSKVSLAGVRTYFVGDRPKGGKWGYGDTSDKTDDNLLDNITFYGKYTCTRINLDGEGEVPTMGLNVWKSFCSGVERHFSLAVLNGPVFD
ncbi:hypothetical protein F5888DRAFT_1689600 [Russula emetica]|nr:hypothetical protein F5888DRAFT_1689600 [Russula emetica]